LEDKDFAADAPYAFAHRENAKIGIGGAPTRNTTMPTDAASRKQYPVASGFMDYFPDAVAEISHLSWKGNEQHNPGQPLHWARGKSGDEADTMLRHFLQRGTRDSDGIRHSVKVCWRALAMLQKEIEEEQRAALPAPMRVKTALELANEYPQPKQDTSSFNQTRNNGERY
jgi:hypothetical protein